MVQIMTRWDRRGQSTLEYLLMAAVIIAAVAVAAKQLIGPAVTKTMNSSSGAIDNAAEQLKNKLGR